MACNIHDSEILNVTKNRVGELPPTQRGVTNRNYSNAMAASNKLVSKNLETTIYCSSSLISSLS